MKLRAIVTMAALILAIIAVSTTTAAAAVPPNATNLANTTCCNCCVNYTWTNGTLGNITDGYNVSMNGKWHNGTNTSLNTCVGPEGWANITVFAYNASGAENLSAGSVSDNVQAPCGTTIILNNSAAGSYAVIYGMNGEKFYNGSKVCLPNGSNIQARGYDSTGAVRGSKVFKKVDCTPLVIEYCNTTIILNNASNVTANGSYAVIYGMPGKFANGSVLSLPMGGNVQARGWDPEGAVYGSKVFKKVDCTPLVIEYCNTTIVLNNSTNGPYAVIYGMSGTFNDSDVLNLPCAGRIQARGWDNDGMATGKVFKTVNGTDLVIEY